MKRLIHTYRRPLIVVLHLGLAVIANYTAFLLRFDGVLPSEHRAPFLASLPWLVGIRGATFWAFHLYEGLWRYSSLGDLRNIIAACALSTGVFVMLIRDVLALTPYPRSVYIIDTMILIGLMGGARFGRRLVRELAPRMMRSWHDAAAAGQVQASTMPRRRQRDEKRILVFGAGDAGEMLVRDMKNNPWYNCAPIGFIDDDEHKVGQTIHGVRVLGSRNDLPRVLARIRPDEVVVAIPRAEPYMIRSIVKSLEHYKIPIKTLPNIRDILEGRVEVSQIRSLALEDLMSRQPVGLDPEPVRRLINGRRVMVTGAGGSVGSELSRQVAALGPATLMALDRYENSLFDLCGDLERRFPSCAYEPVIADVSDGARIEALFAERQPEIVFHAAAHKHVPLMERHPSEAVKNNVRGTRIVAEAAARYGAAAFVLISTDKAVNPSSVMGATKRVGELIIRSMDPATSTRFVAVRFGNVLGSNGSVSRIFGAQIARGGPVTVTHPDITRFFMLIPEAVQLVLHAATMRESGAIYVLDMGEPIRIQDLARNLIRLSGFIPDEDIAIQFTGLRPGEKLSEELVEDREFVAPSGVPQVMRVTSSVLPSDIRRLIARLEQAALDGLDQEALSLLGTIVPTYANQPAAVSTAQGFLR